MVPAVAIQRSPRGPFVYVVKTDQTVEARQVTVGVTDGDDVSIDTGLNLGEQVVVDGADRLRDGTPGGTAGSERLMNLSRPFILRPVATTLLMVAIFLGGALAYRLLPVSALPQVDYPTIQVLTFLSRGEPRGHGLFGHRAAGAPVWTDARPEPDDLDELQRQLGDHPPVHS